MTKIWFLSYGLKLSLPIKFFDHQYLQKESFEILDFWMDRYQGKMTSETTTFVWVWPVVPLVQSGCRILLSSISLKIMDIMFFAWDNHQGQEHLKRPLLLWCGLVCLLSNQIAGFFDHHISGKSLLISQIFCMEIILKGRQHLRLPLLVGCSHVCDLSNEIPGFFEKKYFWRESINIFVWPLS